MKFQSVLFGGLLFFLLRRQFKPRLG